MQNPGERRDKGTEWNEIVALDFTILFFLLPPLYQSFFLYLHNKAQSQGSFPSQSIAGRGKAEKEGEHSTYQLWFCGSWAGFALDLPFSDSAAAQQLLRDGTTWKPAQQHRLRLWLAGMRGLSLESQNVPLPSPQLQATDVWEAERPPALLQ